MADLQTELFTKVIPNMQSLTNLSFDDPEQSEVPVETTPFYKVTNNEVLFNWVKEHPACYAADVCKAMEGQISYSSVQSQLFALARRELLHKATCSTTGNYIYSVAVGTYPRLSRMGQIAKMQEARSKLTREELAARISEGRKAKKQVEAPAPKKKIVLIKKEAPVAAPAVQVTPVDLNTLSIVQARKLYDELKQIFGA